MLKNWFFLGWAALLGGSALGLMACRQNEPPAVVTATPTQAPGGLGAARSQPPVAHRLGKTDFYLSLPPGFALKITEGPDFLVHYFAPADTTVRADFTGGLYLGGYPQGDATDTAGGCRTRRVVVTWQGHPATFTVHCCATGYTVNSVFDSHSGRSWDGRANAFGEAKSAAGLRQLLAVFATLRRQPLPAPQVFFRPKISPLTHGSSTSGGGGSGHGLRRLQGRLRLPGLPAAAGFRGW